MIDGPWYITRAAVEDYMRLCEWPDEDKYFDKAEDALIGLSQKTALVRSQENGFDLYRGPVPNRLRLLVNPTPHANGDKPQLVKVLGEHDGVKRIRHAAAQREVKSFYVDTEEYELWKAAARLEDTSGIPEWIKRVCNEAAQRVRKP